MYKEKIKSAIIWTIAIIAISGLVYGAMFAVDKASNIKSGGTDYNNVGVSEDKLLPVDESDHIRGDKNAKITVIEYSDFECPACVAAAPVVKELIVGYEGKVRFVSRSFPLPQHKLARAASYAAEAAGVQGKFYEMSDVINERKSEWALEKDPTGKFKEYANGIGLDVEKFSADMNSEMIKNKVTRDEQNAYDLQLFQTPSFFIDGKYVNDIGEMKVLLDEKIK